MKLTITTLTGQKINVRAKAEDKVKDLKAQLCRAGRVTSAKLELRHGDVILEDQMPLHFYGVKEGSKIDVIKHYVRVMIENNHGHVIYWRLNRKDAIKEVKAKLAASLSNVSIEQLHLYTIAGKNFDELDDDDQTVENYEIKDGDKLFLLIYKWYDTLDEYKVTVMKTGRELWGLEKDDTGLGVKVKTQDQLGMPVSKIKLAWWAEYEWGENPRGKPRFSRYPHDYIRKFKKLTEIPSDEKNDFNYQLKFVVTEEELKADAARVEEEVKAWREEVRKADKRGDLKEMRKLGYRSLY